MSEIRARLSQLRRAVDEQTGGSIHVARLDRALTSRPDLYTQPDAEAVRHVFSRLAVWASYLAADLEAGATDPRTTATVLRYLEEAGRCVASTASADGQ